MKNSVKAALVALTITMAPAAVQAAERVVVDFGNVAFAYSDGYWDRGHHWHRWQHHRDLVRYRQEHRDNYSNWRHDRDRDQGWHGDR